MKINSQISSLLRTNTALVALCIISIGVLSILSKGVSRGENAPAAPAILPMHAGSLSDSMSPSPSDAPLTKPSVSGLAPSAFESFTYNGQLAVNVSMACNDAYGVILIFPMDIDYRSDPLSALYNNAIACREGQTYTRTVDLAPLNLDLGTKYYVIRASEGNKGTWHDPN